MPKSKIKLPKTFLRDGKRLKKLSKKVGQKGKKTWKYLVQTEIGSENLAKEGARALAVSALGSYLMLSPTSSAFPLHNIQKPSRTEGLLSTGSPTATPAPPLHQPEVLSKLLTNSLPGKTRPLTASEEKIILRILNQAFPLPVKAALQGYRLNTNYGRIGAEQHLPRYPGDKAANHLEFSESGITPRTGAWGFFAPSAKKLTPSLVEKEKYYLAVQTFLSPNWSQNNLAVKKWFQYRKMLVVNPANGKSVVAVVADAGPAVWTGKQFGGSPEVVAALSSRQGIRPQAVLVFFIEDPENNIPLGPLRP